MSVTSIARKGAVVRHHEKAKSNVTYEVIDITPEIAAEMLTHNIDNRRPRRAVVDRYGRDMSSGKWREGVSTISFAADGTLLDGQHRLMAIVQSGCTIPMLVVRGLENEAQDAMDDLAKRTLGDTFNFHGIQNSNQSAAIVRRIILWEQGERTNTGRYQPTKAESLELWRRDHTVAIALEAAARLRTRRIVTPSIVGLTYWLFWNIDSDDCQNFWDSLHTGIGLEEDSPIYIVREQIARYNARGERVPETAYLAWVIKAWNHYRSGKTLRPGYKYTLKASERVPEPK